MIIWARPSATGNPESATRRTVVDRLLSALLAESVVGFALGMSPQHVSCTALDPPICRSAPGNDLILGIVSVVGGMLIIACKRMRRHRPLPEQTPPAGRDDHRRPTEHRLHRSNRHRHGAISDVRDVDAKYRR